MQPTVQRNVRQIRRRLKDLLYSVSLAGLHQAVLGLTDAQAATVGRCLGRLAFRLARDEAKRARGQLAQAFPSWSAEEVERQARRCFEHLGTLAVEVLRFDRLSPSRLAEIVTLEGREHLETALQKGNGAIVVTGHIGNWELLGARLAHLGPPMVALGRELRSPALHRIVSRQRQAVGCRVVSRDRSVREAVRTLRQNGIVVLLADVDTQVEGRFVPFFGRPAHTPIGPVKLSQRYGAPVLPAYIHRLGPGRHRLRILPPLELADTGSPEADLIANIAQYTQALEAAVRAVPEQWIWNHSRWKTQPNDLASAS